MSLPVFQATIVNDSGDIIPSAVITVLDEITGLGLTVYSNRAGTVPLGTNGVFTAGTDGFAQFFAPAGNYRVKAEQAASGFEKTWDFVPLVGGSAFDANSYTALGLGVDGITATGSLNNIVDQGFYGVIYTSVSDLPSDYPTTGRGALNVFRRNDASITQELYDARTPAKWVRHYYTTWSDWKRTDPQAFGIGGYVISADTDYDAGDYLVGGNYITPSSAMSNAPSDYTSGRHVIAVDGTAIYIAQTLYGVTGSDKGKIWSRAFNGVTWSDWKRTDPQAFGLGLDDPLNEAPITDLHDLSVTTLTAYSSPDANTPTNLNGVVRFEARNGGTSSIRGYLYAVDSDGMHYSKTNVGGTWEAWQPVYTGANLNPNVFGGGGFVATGWASSDTVARFLLPTHGISDATSITLGGGTFDVLAGASAVTGGVNTTAITLGSSGANTPMGTIIQVSGLSGMVSGDYLQLFGDTSNSQITVNF